MKAYTKEDMKNFNRDDYGNLICPTGDYSQIRSFDNRCSFGKCCSFSERSSFGEYCSFGYGCSFGEWCSFGKSCTFDKSCSFGEWCSFEECCSFGKECSFGKYCGFGKECSFGWGCSFGEWISFGKACSFEGGRVKSGEYFACDRIGSQRRKTYFFRDSDGKMYVRAGCWFSSLDEFIERVKEAHGGTKYEKEYLAAVELAKIVLEGVG